MLIISTSGFVCVCVRMCEILYSVHILWTETREINTASSNEQTLAARAGADLWTDEGTVQHATECSCHLYIAKRSKMCLLSPKVVLENIHKYEG